MKIDFWNVLFEPREWINIVNDVKGTYVVPFDWLKDKRGTEQFFCINPLTQFGRKDANVTCFRNILIEFDNLPLKTQLDFTQTIPFSTMTFSGGKSYHYIISLEEPCTDIKEYKKLVRRIYKKLPDCDKSTGNPSRLSRTPDAVRDNGVVQKLMIVRQRITKAVLEDWLGPDTDEGFNPSVRLPMKANGRRLLPTRVLAFIEYGAAEGGRNRALFINACELFRANYDKEEIFDIAMKVLDLPVYEIRSCIESARKAVAQE